MILALAGCAGDSPGNFFASRSSSVSDDPAANPSSLEQASAADPDLKLVPELPKPKNSAGTADDVIITGDIIQVEVFGQDKLNRTVHVGNNGQIRLPLIGTVQAAGKSIPVLEQEIAARYERDYIKAPSVTLTLKDSPVRRVVVEGEVARSGVFAVSSRSTLMEALAQAGGFTERSDPSKIYVFRSIGTERFVANYDVDAIRNGRRPNPQIYGGDVVVVFASGARIAWQNLKDILGVTRTVVGGIPLR